MSQSAYKNKQEKQVCEKRKKKKIKTRCPTPNLPLLFHLHHQTTKSDMHLDTPNYHCFSKLKASLSMPAVKIVCGHFSVFLLKISNFFILKKKRKPKRWSDHPKCKREGGRTTQKIHPPPP